MKHYVKDPSRRRAYRAFKAASEFGVLYSHASQMVYDDLVDDGGPDAPMTASQATELKQRVLRAQPGIQAMLVARVAQSDGSSQWRDAFGRSPEEALRQFREAASPYRRLNRVAP